MSSVLERELINAIDFTHVIHAGRSRRKWATRLAERIEITLEVAGADLEVLVRPRRAAGPG